MNKKILFSVLFLMLGFYFPINVLAQNINDPEVNKIETIATVNVYNAEIISQENNKFKISFDISNREKVQPDINYSIKLIKETKNGREFVDEKNYLEKISLGADESIKREVEYEAPLYFDGEATLWLVAKNSSGIVFSVNLIGNVSLKGSGNYVEIDSSKCFISVIGDLSDKKYPLSEIISIAKGDEIEINCSAINNFDKQIEVSSIYEIYSDDLILEKNSDKVEDLSKFLIKTNEKVNFKINLPKVDEGKFYKSNIFLVSESEVISNKIQFKYIVKGENINIGNVRLDKDYYEKDEIAIMSVFWSMNNDVSYQFNNEVYRLNEDKFYLKIGVENKNGDKCSNDFKDSLTGKSNNFELTIPIIEKCIDPKISLNVESESGVEVFSKEVSVKSGNYTIESIESIESEKVCEDGTGNPVHCAVSSVENKDNSIDILKSFILVAFVISIILIIISFIKKRKKIGSVFSFFVFIFSALFFCTNFAEADTVSIGSNSSVTFVYNLNKTTYFSGEEIIASVFTSSANSIPPDCGLLPLSSLYTSFSNNNWTSETKILGARCVNSNRINVVGQYDPVTGGMSGEKVFIAPSVGNYNIGFKLETLIQLSPSIPPSGGSKTFNLPYSVVPCDDSTWNPPLNTVCSGVSFTQTNICGNSKTSIGTKTDGLCCTTSYSNYICNKTPSIDCSLASNCGKTVTESASCSAINICSGSTVSRPLNECGSSCTTNTTQCPACSSSEVGSWIEIAP